MVSVPCAAYVRVLPLSLKIVVSALVPAPLVVRVPAEP